MLDRATHYAMASRFLDQAHKLLQQGGKAKTNEDEEATLWLVDRSLNFASIHALMAAVPGEVALQAAGIEAQSSTPTHAPAPDNQPAPPTDNVTNE